MRSISRDMERKKMRACLKFALGKDERTQMRQELEYLKSSLLVAQQMFSHAQSQEQGLVQISHLTALLDGQHFITQAVQRIEERSTQRLDQLAFQQED
jgi:hypothetical protein